MKNSALLFFAHFFSFRSVHRDGGLYSRAFRMVRHSQQSRWTSYLATCQRHRGESGQSMGKPFATYREWQPGSEYHGLHIRRTNHTE